VALSAELSVLGFFGRNVLCTVNLRHTNWILFICSFLLLIMKETALSALSVAEDRNALSSSVYVRTSVTLGCSSGCNCQPSCDIGPRVIYIYIYTYTYSICVCVCVYTHTHTHIACIILPIRQLHSSYSTVYCMAYDSFITSMYTSTCFDLKSHVRALVVTVWTLCEQALRLYFAVKLLCTGLLVIFHIDDVAAKLKLQGIAKCVSGFVVISYESRLVDKVGWNVCGKFAFWNDVRTFDLT
jgi:hypothetical protein